MAGALAVATPCVPLPAATPPTPSGHATTAGGLAVVVPVLVAVTAQAGAVPAVLVAHLQAPLSDTALL